MLYLGIEDLLDLTASLGAGPVRDLGLLESAAARPQTAVLGEDAYPTLELKAAALLHSICRNDALVDENRRLAWLAAVVFLNVNAGRVVLADDEAFDLVRGVAEGRLDVAEIAAALSVEE